MKTKIFQQKLPFADRLSVRREQSGFCLGSTGCGYTRRAIPGNGLSRTAMLFNIAKVAGRRLTVAELNRVKNIDPRSLERVYDEVLWMGDPGNARFALKLVIG